ncbi:MAG TPA: hypothetical protein DCP38_15915, partial [Acidobacteria bacterium]|nr:hypothetical protein [Acidobacteriota bacterium]
PPNRRTSPKREREPADQPAGQRRGFVERPGGGVAAGPADHGGIGRVLLSKKAQDRPKRRDADRAVPETGGMQPVLVVVEPGRQLVDDCLMHARRQHPSDAGLTHYLIRLPWRMCTAAIIAGGEARRLGGQPKGALAFGATSIIERQFAVLRSITETVFVVANDPEPYAGLGVPVITDEVPGAGALGGVYTALVRATADPVLVVACDMPFIHAAFLRHLVESAGSADVAIPRTAAGYEPLCACYARRCAPRLRQQIDDGVLKVQELLRHVKVREVGPDEIAPHDPDGVLFSNVNTPEDYARALERLAAYPSGPAAPGRDRNV